MAESLEKYIKPIPILQWLVVIVLSAHVLLSGESSLGTTEGAVFVLAMLTGNLALLHGLPRFMSQSGMVTTLVVIDTLLVPMTLHLTGSSTADLFVSYFGIIMIAGAAGDLKRALVLASVTCLAYLGYGAFMLATGQETVPLGTVLLRLPFLLVMTLFYGALAEFAQRERTHREKLTHAAMHDELTGMPNRRHLVETLARYLEEARRFKSPLSCAVMDLDNFKAINDTYGHDMGDLVLKDYSSLLAVQSRGYDLAGRLGGDEYVWILPRVEKEGAIAAGERLREAVERYQFGNSGTAFRLTTSIGVTTYHPGQDGHPTPAQMLKAGDVALYMAKREGRNRVCYLPLQDTVAAEAEPADEKTVKT